MLTHVTCLFLANVVVSPLGEDLDLDVIWWIWGSISGRGREGKSTGRGGYSKRRKGTEV